jgi:hypothetical protein
MAPHSSRRNDGRSVLLYQKSGHGQEALDHHVKKRMMMRSIYFFLLRYYSMLLRHVQSASTWLIEVDD